MKNFIEHLPERTTTGWYKLVVPGGDSSARTTPLLCVAQRGREEGRTASDSTEAAGEAAYWKKYDDV